MHDVIHGMKVATIQCQKNINKEMHMKIRNKLISLSCLGVFFIPLILGLAGCSNSTVQSMGWSGVMPDSEGVYLASLKGILNGANGTQLWEIPIESTNNSGNFLGCSTATASVAIYGTPAIDEDIIYLAGYNGVIYAYDKNTRLSKSKILDENDQQSIVGSPVIHQGILYVTSTNGKVYALETPSLDKLWEFTSGDKIWTTPVVQGQTIFVGSFDKKLYALDITTGEEKWSFATKGAIVASPIIDGNTVIVASFDRHIYALDIEKGNLLWTYPGSETVPNTPQKWFWASPVIYDNHIYAPNMDGNVYVIDIQDGSLITTFELDSGISSSPVVVKDKIIIATEKGTIYSLQAETNLRTEIKSLNSKVRSALAVMSDTVYIHTLENEAVYALNPETGVVYWYTPIDE